MTLRIKEEELRRLEQHAAEGYPSEVVGILAGSRSAWLVSRVHPLVNERSETRNRYRVGPMEIMRAERSIETEGLEVVGYYHSHPDHTARYSDYDREHALPNMSYVIASVLDGRPSDVLAWKLREDRSAMEPEMIEVIHMEEK